MENIKEETEVNQVKAELVKKNLILEQLDTFLVEYNFKTEELYIDPVKEKFIKVPWNIDSIIDKEEMEKIVFRPDISAVREFLDFGNVKPETKKRNITVRLFTESHQYQWYRVSQICFFNEKKELERVVISFTNTDESTEIEQSLKFHSEKDPLTHLPNINAFSRTVTEMTQKDPAGKFSIIRMDVEGFRVINDMFGEKEETGSLHILV